MAKTPVTLGQGTTKYSTILVDITGITNNFIQTCFFCNSDYDDDTKKSIVEKLPGIDGSISGSTTKLSGGIKSILDAFIRFFYKIFGIFVEEFLLLIVKPLKNLITNLLANQYFPLPSPALNPTLTSDVIFQSSMNSNPATASLGIASLISMLKDQIEQIKSLLLNVVSPILQLLTNTQQFILNLVSDGVFTNFNIPMPDIGLGILGITLSSLDMNNIFSGLGINLKGDNTFNISDTGSKDVDYRIKANSINSKLKDYKFNFTVPSNLSSQGINIDLSDLEFADVLNKDPILQLDYMNCVSSYGFLPAFYKEPYQYNPFPDVDKLNNSAITHFDGYYSYTFDFFKNFTLYTASASASTNNVIISGQTYIINVPGYTNRGLYDCLYDAGLLEDVNFIGKVFKFIQSHSNDSTLPEQFKTLISKYTFNTKKLVLNGGSDISVSNKLTVKSIKDLPGSTNTDKLNYFASQQKLKQTTVVGNDLAGYELYRPDVKGNLTLLSQGSTIQELVSNYVKKYPNAELDIIGNTQLGFYLVESGKIITSGKTYNDMINSYITHKINSTTILETQGKVYLVTSNGKFITGKTINEIDTFSNKFNYLIFNLDYSLTKTNFLNVLSRTFNYNLWNTKQANGKPTLYINGGTALPKDNPNKDLYTITQWNYKKFKLDFFNLIPANKLEHFMSHVQVNITNFEEVDEYKDGLTGSVADFIKNSQTRVNDKLIVGVIPLILGCLQKKYKVGTTNGDIISRYRKKLISNKPDKLFSDDLYNKFTGLPNLGTINFPKIPGINIPDLNLTKGEKALKDNDANTLTSKIGWVNGLIGFFTSLFSFPINYLMGYIEKFLGIIKSLLSFNIPKAVSQITGLLKGFIPNIGGIGTMVKDLLGPIILPFVVGLKLAYDTGFQNLKAKLPNLDLPQIDINSLLNVMFNPLGTGKIRTSISDFVVYFDTEPGDVTGINFPNLKDILNSLLPIIAGVGDIFGGLRTFLLWLICLIKSCVYLFIDLILPVADHIFTVVGKEIPLLRPVTEGLIAGVDFFASSDPLIIS